MILRWQDNVVHLKKGNVFYLEADFKISFLTIGNLNQVKKNQKFWKTLKYNQAPSKDYSTLKHQKFKSEYGLTEFNKQKTTKNYPKY